MFYCLFFFFSADPDPLRLFVTGFGPAVKEIDLYKVFSKADEVVIPRRLKDKTPLG
jgi:hypothetical protein